MSHVKIQATEQQLDLLCAPVFINILSSGPVFVGVLQRVEQVC